MPEFDETFDFVVVGAGGGSMCAGLVMRQAGKSVVVLEKTELLGGSTARAGGVMWIPNNRFMKRDGVEDYFDKAASYLDNVVGDREDTPGATRERRHTYLREAPEMLEFLIGKGIQFNRAPYWPDYYTNAPGASEEGRTVLADLFDINQLGEWKDKLRPNKFQLAAPIVEAMSLPLIRVSWKARWQALKVVWRTITAKLTGKHWVTAGAALQSRMLQAAVREGVDLRTNVGVKEVLVDGNRCIGVVIEKDGKPWRIGANLGVLLNAGGFARNQEMRDEYIPHTRKEWTHAAPGDTGDMHKEMMRHGAWMAHMDEFVGNQMALPPTDNDPAGMQTQICKPHAFLVDQTGIRYMNEGGSYMLFCQGSARTPQDRAGGAQLADLRQPVPAQVHDLRSHARRRHSESLVGQQVPQNRKHTRRAGCGLQHPRRQPHRHRREVQRLRAGQGKDDRIRPRRQRLRSFPRRLYPHPQRHPRHGRGRPVLRGRDRAGRCRHLRRRGLRCQRAGDEARPHGDRGALRHRHDHGGRDGPRLSGRGLLDRAELHLGLCCGEACGGTGKFGGLR